MRFSKGNQFANVARNPQDNPKYAEPNEVKPAPRPIRVDTAGLSEAEILERYEDARRQRYTGNASRMRLENYDCQFCMDTRHIRVRRVWAVREFINRVEVNQHLTKLAGNEPLDQHYETYVRCSCASDETSNGTDAKGHTQWRRTRRFTEIFGVSIQDHDFGKMLLAERQRQQNSLDTNPESLDENLNNADFKPTKPMLEEELSPEARLQQQAIDEVTAMFEPYKDDFESKEAYDAELFEATKRRVDELKGGIAA